MGSISITELLGAYNARDFGAAGDDNGDDSPEINEALRRAGADSGRGIVFLPPGTYRCGSPIEVPSSVLLCGFGAMSVLKLGPSNNVDVLRAALDATSVRIRDLRVDANRANNSLGTGHGVNLEGVVDAWLDNVEVVSARSDGFHLQRCSRVEMNGCRSSDNGRHGISLNDAEFCLLMACRAFDNCQVSAVGTADGINLDLLTHDCTIIAPLCYETSLTGDRQGYGLLEAPAGGCYRNLVIGGAFRGNRTGALSIGPDSLAISQGYTQIPTGVVITP